MKGLVAFALGTLLLAGCLGSPSSDLDGLTVTLPAEPARPLLAVEAHKCSLAGGVTTNPGPPQTADEFLPKPFQAADTSGYLGVPATGTSFGVLHSAFSCHMWTVNGQASHLAAGGFVGALVKPPPFQEVKPVDHNILVATLSTRNEVITNVLKDAGWYVYPGLGTVDEDEEGGMWWVRAVLATAGDGTYESILTMQPRGPSWDVLRFWLIVDGKDGELHPAHFDLRLKGGTTYVGPGYFSHIGGGDHFGGQAVAPVGGLGFKGFDFEVDFGVLQATVETMYDH